MCVTCPCPQPAPPLQRSPWGSFLSHSGSELLRGLSYGGGLLYTSHPLGLQTQEKAHPPRFWQLAGVAPDTEVFRLRQSVFPSHILPFNFSVTNSCKKLPNFWVCQGSVLQLPSLQSLATAHDKERLATSLPKGMDHVVVDLAGAFCKPERNLAQAQG